jgi:hypothetical protein
MIPSAVRRTGPHLNREYTDEMMADLPIPHTPIRCVASDLFLLDRPGVVPLDRVEQIHPP